jgi:hypothetical protein
LKFDFEVGDSERHEVHFAFNQAWAQLSISVDGEKVIKDFKMFSASLTDTYRFTVGVDEKHEVVIEKRRPLFLAGFRKQKCSVFVDGEMVGTFGS